MKTPKRSIAKIVKYLWEQEKNHFIEEIENEASSIKKHIFIDLDKVKKWLDFKNISNV